MKKIAIISDHASPLAFLGSVDNGGQNIYVKNIAHVFALKGYEVDIFTRKDRPDLPETLRMEPRVRVIHVPAGPDQSIEKEKLLDYMEEFTAFLDNFIRRQNRIYDWIHANFFMSGLAALKIKSRFGIPFFITFHALGRIRRFYQMDKDTFPDKRFQIEDDIVREADGIIAECPQDQQDLITYYGAQPDKIHIAPCGVDLKELYPVEKKKAREYLKIDKKEKVILQLGRLVPRKGVDTVIQALSLLQKRHRLSARLLIVGGPPKTEDCLKNPEIQRLKEVADSQGVQDRVSFCGQAQRQILKFYYSASDIFVTTPWYEPFGITPLEAMACSTPVVGSRVGGISYTVLEKKTGLLVPPKDPLSLANAMAFLYKNPSKMKDFGRQGHHRVKKHFTWQIVGDDLADYFEGMLSRPVFSIKAQRAILEMNKRLLPGEEA